MKYCLLLLFLFVGRQVTRAQTIAPGYYISLNNDTVKVDVKVPKLLFGGVDVESLERRVKAADSTGDRFEKFKPEKIKGFGFTYKDKEYNFATKHIKGYGNKFWEQVFSGSKASLYSYYTYTADNYSRKYYTYIVSNPNGDEIILRNTMSRRKMRKKLKNLFQDEANSQGIIDSSSIAYRHITSSLKEIVEALNKS